MPDTTKTPMQCRHVFTDGHRCLGHRLRHQDFCYFHHTARRPIENPAARRRRGTTFTLPELEDRAAIQLALSEILQRIAANDLDPKRAGHLLYGLQIASTLLPKLDPKANPRTVAEITHDEELGDLAPAQVVGTDREPSAWEIVLDRFDEMDNRKDEEEPAPKPFDFNSLPDIQAVASLDSELTPLNPKLLNKNAFAQSHTESLRVPPPLTQRRRGRAKARRSPQTSRRSRRKTTTALVYKLWVWNGS